MYANSEHINMNELVTFTFHKGYALCVGAMDGEHDVAIGNVNVGYLVVYGGDKSVCILCQIGTF